MNEDGVVEQEFPACFEFWANILMGVDSFEYGLVLDMGERLPFSSPCLLSSVLHLRLPWIKQQTTLSLPDTERFPKENKR